jgi:predicted permease
LTESLLLSIVGSAAGLLLGSTALRILIRTTDAPEWIDPTPDWRVILFALGAGFASALLFGLTPALQIARQRSQASTLRQVLIGGQVAGSCVLLIVAGLLVRALDRALYAHPGFEYKQVITIDPHLSAHGYSPENAKAFLYALQTRMRALPGVDSVSLASSPPLGRKSTVWSSSVDGRFSNVHVNRVDSEFFTTMRIPLRRGRAIAAGDMHSIVISESLAHRQWPQDDAVGKEFPMEDRKFIIGGVAGNARVMALEDPDAVEAYLAPEPADWAAMSELVKTSGSPEALAPSKATIARAVDPKVRPEIDLMRSGFNRRLESTRSSALAVSLLGLIALLLACLGIVGLVAYAVSQRTKEIGIRMALGAAPVRVLSLVLRQFSIPVVAGLSIGVLGAAALSQILRRQLFGISHLDPVAYSAAVILFVVTAACAALIPARRALGVNPLQALRHD